MGGEVVEKASGRPGRRRRLLSVFAIAVLLAALFPAVAFAASMSLAPDKGTRGSGFVVSGSGFDSGALVTILWDGVVPLSLTTADDSGSFSVSVSVPVLTSSGAHTVAAQALGDSASARFVVQGEETTTTTTPPTTTTTTTTVPPPTTTTTTTPPPPSTAPTTTSTTAPKASTPPPPKPTSTTTPTPTPTTSGEQAPAEPPPPSPPTVPDVSGSGDTTPTTTPSGEGDITTTTAPGTDPEDPDGENETPDGLAAGGGPGSGPPEALGPTDSDTPAFAPTRMAVEAFVVRPATATGGSNIRLMIQFEEVVAGLSSVVFSLDDEQLGDPVEVTGSQLDVTRRVPNTPGRHVIEIRSGDTLLAQTRIVIVAGAEHLSPTAMSVIVAFLLGAGFALTLAAARWFRRVDYGDIWSLRLNWSRWRRRLAALRR